MSVPFTRLVVLATLAGHGRGIARPRDPAALERTSSTCVPQDTACNILQYSARATAMNFMQSAVAVGDGDARAGQTRSSVRRLCQTAPVAPRSNTGRASSLCHMPASQHGQLTSSSCSFIASAGRSATEPRPNVPHAKAHTTPTHPPRQPRHLRAGTSLGFKQLRSLNYKRPFFKNRTHNEPLHSKWNCDPSPRQHSAAAERLNLGTALAVDDGFSFYSNFNRAIIKTAVLALSGSVKHGGIRVLLMAAALPTATAMPLRPGIPEPDSEEEEEVEPSDGSKSEVEGDETTGTAPPEAVVSNQGGRPGPQPWYFALHVPGQGYGVFSDWDLSAAHGAVGGKQNFNKKFRSFEEAANKASFRCPGARVPQFPHELDVWFSLIATEPAMTKAGGSGARAHGGTAAAPMGAPPMPRQSSHPTTVSPRALFHSSIPATGTVTGPPPSVLTSS